jgi:hypothetical protein
MLSLRSAVSMKFSRAFKSALNAKLCPKKAIKSISAIYSELSVKSLKSSG